MLSRADERIKYVVFLVVINIGVHKSESYGIANLVNRLQKQTRANYYNARFVSDNRTRYTRANRASQ